jgi:hypothetical protein
MRRVWKMNWEQLDKINKLVERLEDVRSFIANADAYKFGLRANNAGGNCVKVLAVDWGLIEPVLKNEYEELVNELKELGYEDE